MTAQAHTQQLLICASGLKQDPPSEFGIPGLLGKGGVYLKYTAGGGSYFGTFYFYGLLPRASLGYLQSTSCVWGTYTPPFLAHYPTGAPACVSHLVPQQHNQNKEPTPIDNQLVRGGAWALTTEFRIIIVWSELLKVSDY